LVRANDASVDSEGYGHLALSRGAGDEDEAAAGDSVVLGADALELPGLLPGTGLLPAAPERDFGDGQAYEGLGGSGR